MLSVHRRVIPIPPRLPDSLPSTICLSNQQSHLAEPMFSINPTANHCYLYDTITLDMTNVFHESNS